MSKLKIFISKYEESLGSARKIQEEANFDVDILYIEEFFSEENSNNIFEKDIVYFLCASSLIQRVINNLKKTKCTIINEGYFLNNYQKKDIQKLLKKNHINVPHIYFNNSLEHKKFPLFCKENRHTGITVKIYNKNSLEQFFQKFNTENFYLEEPINETEENQEFKVYFVDKRIYYKNNEAQRNLEVEKICDKIEKDIFKNIKIFSIDFIYEKQYYIIDFNPSSGFYASDKARKAFIEYCNKLIIKNQKF